MPQWVSAAKIVAEYAVGESKLLQYSARGNLPCKQESGAMLYDLEHVAQFFRLRSALQIALPESESGFGKLGALHLGQSSTVEPSMPVRRQRKVMRVESNASLAEHGLARTEHSGVTRIAELSDTQRRTA